jgi:hypothetical protein
MESIIGVSNGFGGFVRLSVSNEQPISSLLENDSYRRILEDAGILFKTSSFENVRFCVFSGDIQNNSEVYRNETFQQIRQTGILGIIHRAGSVESV